MDGGIQNIPKKLVYEWVEGKPIFYGGYESYLAGERQLDELMGISKLEAFLITELIFLSRNFLGQEYYIFSNEIGLQLSPNTWRAVDWAVIPKSEIDEIIDNK